MIPPHVFSTDLSVGWLTPGSKLFELGVGGGVSLLWDRLGQVPRLTLVSQGLPGPSCPKRCPLLLPWDTPARPFKLGFMSKQKEQSLTPGRLWLQRRPLQSRRAGDRGGVGAQGTWNHLHSTVLWTRKSRPGWSVQGPVSHQQRGK